MNSEQDHGPKEPLDSEATPAIEAIEPTTEPADLLEPDEVETIFFEQPTLGYDPVEKIDKLIDETAEHYLTDLIHNLDQLPRPISLGKRVAKASLFTALSFVILTGVVAVSYSISHLPLRSHFLGVDTSNSLPQKAYEDIQSEINPILANPINIKSKSTTLQFTPERLGIKLDLVATLNQAPKNPFSSIYSLLVPIGIDPVFEIDENKFATALNSIAIEQEVEPKVAEIEIVNGEVSTYRQINGQSINWQKTINELERNWLRNDQPLPLVFDEIEPAITDADVKLLAQAAESMLSQPVKIRFANQTRAFERSDIGEALSIQQNDGNLTLELNSNILWNQLGSKFLGINQPVRNAQLEIVNDKPVITPANTAAKITSSEFKKLFSDQLKNKGDRLIDLTTFEVTPSVSTADIQALGIVEKVSEYRQWFPPAQYRTLNVGTAARFIDGKILKPGEIYSMNDTIKERTEENGYVPGIFISNGRFEEGYGGGVSIITTALWTAAFFAGLEPIEQRAHSIYIPRYQEGIEATVQWGSLDLKFKNNLDHAIMFKTKVDADGVTITLYGTKKFDQVIAKKTNRYNVKEYKTVYSESKSCIPQEGQPGFGVTVTRELLKAGSVVKTDEFKTNYRVGNEVICGPNPKKNKTEEPPVEGELITAAE